MDNRWILMESYKFWWNPMDFDWF